VTQLRRAKWELRHPERAALEDELMRSHTNAKKHYRNMQVVWLEEMLNNFRTPFTWKWPVPDNYPFGSVKGFLVSPYIKPDIRYHMYSDGSICEAGARTASSRTSILAVRNRCVAWATFYELSMRNARQTGHFRWMGPGHY